MQGSKLKKILRSPCGDQLEKYSRQMQIFSRSLYNVNDVAHSMARSIRFDCLKISWTEVGINFKVNSFVYVIWHIFYDESKAR